MLQTLTIGKTNATTEQEYFAKTLYDVCQKKVEEDVEKVKQKKKIAVEKMKQETQKRVEKDLRSI